MIGLLKVAPGDTQLELREVELREPAEGEVVIRVRYAGICGTDIHIRDDHFQSYPPVILGHEFTGTVERLGEGVDPTCRAHGWSCEPHARACHTCFLCRRGNPEICAVEAVARAGASMAPSPRTSWYRPGSSIGCPTSCPTRSPCSRSRWR